MLSRIYGGSSVMTIDNKVQYLLDRLEIQDVLALYARGQDDHQGYDGGILDDWNRVFTPDATVDYTEAGPPFGIFSHVELAAVMRGVAHDPGLMNGSFHKWQHMQGLPTVEIAGDSAKVRTDLLATHVGRTHADTPWHLFDAAIFHDDFVRTPLGWRIAYRRLQVTYVEVVETIAPGKTLQTLMGEPQAVLEGAGQ
jgi:hypothetical protein